MIKIYFDFGMTDYTLTNLNRNVISTNVCWTWFSNEEWETRNLNRTSDNQQHLILIFFYLINPLIASLDTFNKNIIFKSLFHFALMQNETKNQDLDFQRSITVLIPKRKKLTTFKQFFFLRHFQTIDTRLQILCRV